MNWEKLPECIIETHYCQGCYTQSELDSEETNAKRIA